MLRIHSTTLALVASLTLTFAAPVLAQDVATPPAGAKGNAPLAPAAGRFTRVPARDVAARLSRATGVLVLADQSVAAAPVTIDVGASLLPAALARIAAALPEGTVVKTAYLPADTLADRVAPPDAGKIAALVAAQEALLPATATTVPAAAGEVIIQGKRLSPDKAAPVIAALDLKPVYLLTRASGGATDDPVQKLTNAQTDALKTWLAMTPEQQKAAADRQIDTLLNMDPALRQQVFAQQRQALQTMFQRIQQLPEGQRQQFLRELTGGLWDGTPRQPGGGNNAPRP